MTPIQRLRKMLTFAYKIESIDKDPFIKFNLRILKTNVHF